MSPLEIRRRNVYRVGDTTADRPGPARERRGARGPRGGGRGVRVRARRGGAAARRRAGRATGRRRAPASGHRARARLARRRVHRLRRGAARQRRDRRADGGRRDPRPDRLDRDGPGVADDPRAARRRARSAWTRDAVEVARPGHLARARQRADGRLADDDGRRRAAGDRRRRTCGATWRPHRRRPFAGVVPATTRGRTAPLRVTEQFDGFPGIAWDDARPTAATPIRPSAGRAPWPRWTWTSTPARCASVGRRPPTRGRS